MRGCVAWVLVGMLAAVAEAAPPLVPEQVSYQGLLLDGTGAPRTGNVDLTLRIYDALSGGTLLYVQVFSATPLTDGVFSVMLGPSGEATDTPDDPLSTSLAEALAGDLGATGPDRFLEVTVGVEGALARTQILAVPYAVHAETADRAALADQAASAASADNATSVGGLDASFVTQLYEHVNFDGQPPPNDAPDEGLADVDGDGKANFIDPDNDDDGILDGTEILNGTGINLVTPTFAQVTPPSADADLTHLVTVTGTNFEVGMAVAFGSENPSPANLSPTSLDVTVGPQTPGVKTVTLTRLNGESASGSFEFVKIVPGIVLFSPPYGSGSVPTLVTVTGTNFQPDMSVVFGSETPTPMNVTPTSFEVTVGPQSGIVPVTITLVNGNSGQSSYLFGLVDGDPVAHGVSVSGQMSFAVKGSMQTILGTEAGYWVDTDGDRVPELPLPFASNSQTSPGQIAVGWSPAGDVSGLTCRSTGVGNDCTVEFVTDSDADFALDDETGVLVEAVSGGPLGRIESPSLTFDASGHAVLGYLRHKQASPVDVVVAHDIDGDGLFTGTNEVVSPDTASTGSGVAALGEVATGAGGAVAYVYRKGSNSVGVVYDPEGDGTYLQTSWGTSGTLACVGAAYDSTGTLAVVYGSSSDGAVLWRSTSPNPTFTTLTSEAVSACDVVGGLASGLAVAHNGEGLVLLKDQDQDGFLESALPLEDPTTASVLELRRNATGRVYLATQDRILVDPSPSP